MRLKTTPAPLIALLCSAFLACAGTSKSSMSAAAESSTASSALAPAAPEPEPVAARPPAPAPAPAIAGLRFSVEPEDAQVIVDEQVRGTVAELSASGGVLPLPPGLYRVSLKRGGYQTWRGEVAVGTNTEVLDVKLQPKK
jgi:hypothetical protein